MTGRHRIDLAGSRRLALQGSFKSSARSSIFPNNSEASDIGLINAFAHRKGPRICGTVSVADSSAPITWGNAMETLAKTARLAAVLVGLLIVSGIWMPPAAAVPGDFSLDLCVGLTCTELPAIADPTTGQLNVTFPDTPVGAVASFTGLTFTGSVDPSVSGSFTLTNLSNSKQTFSVSATLGVLPVGGPTTLSASYGAALLSDGSDDGAEMTAILFYRALIDGVAMIDLGNNLDAIAGPASSTAIPQEASSNQPGPGVATSIGVAFPAFTLTAHDSVQVPFSFTVVQTREQVPEPASLALLGLAFAAASLSRRRRRS